MSDSEPVTDHQECPHCGESWDHLGDQPALEEIGMNPYSGTLYHCHCCHDRVTDDEIETGKQSQKLVAEGYYAE